MGLYRTISEINGENGIVYLMPHLRGLQLELCISIGARKPSVTACVFINHSSGIGQTDRDEHALHADTDGRIC